MFNLEENNGQKENQEGQENSESNPPEVPGINDKKLINYVRQCPLLWNQNVRDYKNIKLKDSCWSQIAKKFPKISPEKCAKRWGQLRESYRKERRKRQEELERGINTGREGFLNFKLMSFVEAGAKPKKTSAVRGTLTLVNLVPKESLNGTPSASGHNSSADDTMDDKEEHDPLGSDNDQDTPNNNQHLRKILPKRTGVFSNDNPEIMEFNMSPWSPPWISDNNSSQPTTSCYQKDNVKPDNATLASYVMDLGKMFKRHIEEEKEAKRLKRESEESKQNLTSSADDELVFAHFIASELRKMDNSERKDKKRRITDIIFDSFPNS